MRNDLIKRIFDIIITILGLLIISPIIIFLSFLAWVVQGSPIVFRQTRAGMHGNSFTLYKFRTMNDAVSPDGDLLPDAQRLTRFGKILRDTSLDELPQLFNVIKGDLSLVGPRPLLMEYLSLYTHEQSRRHEVKPGITGWAQVNGRQNLKYSKKLEYDVWYVDNWNFFLDIKILLMTFLMVIRRKNVNSGYDYKEVDDLGLTKNLKLKPFSKLNKNKLQYK